MFILIFSMKFCTVFDFSELVVELYIWINIFFFFLCENLNVVGTHFEASIENHNKCFTEK